MVQCLRIHFQKVPELCLNYVWIMFEFDIWHGVTVVSDVVRNANMRRAKMTTFLEN